MIVLKISKTRVNQTGNEYFLKVLSYEVVNKFCDKGSLKFTVLMSCIKSFFDFPGFHKSTTIYAISSINSNNFYEKYSTHFLIFSSYLKLLKW